ncbi:hypothetical protein [Mycolicibacterium aichiense]|uniref:Uncharacterized protein n=2 Tax=Mycolicibacterium TaxID=1866885 RepID=A0AAD1MEH1_9MYCO|nr:hypothetical protein [Mycolicibacterium aichiense]MCV7016287.1 hypothetical protein [Mycolicibacterium aichiense]BBX09946.1 hypothetical protein MAIC_47490 [Mycolicibacterium aichiense]STZ26390.1 Uncharacterised protein [Mycolicibacterium aichiense]
MPNYDCTFILTNPYSTDAVPDVENLAVRAYNHMYDKSEEGWRLVSTSTPPDANALMFFWEQVEPD